MTSQDALQRVVGEKIVSVTGTTSGIAKDEVHDLLITTTKWRLYGYVTNDEGIMFEVEPRYGEQTA